MDGSLSWKWGQEKRMFLVYIFLTEKNNGTFLMVQSIGTHLPMQGTRVQFRRTREDSTCLEATKLLGTIAEPAH